MEPFTSHFSPIGNSIQQGIAAQKRSQNSLAKREEFYRAAFHTAPDAISIRRLDSGKYVDVNEAFLSLTGYAREDISSEFEIWASESDHMTFINMIMTKGHVTNMRVKVRLKNNHLAHAIISAKRVTLNNKQYIINVIKDITELKKTETALRASEEIYKTLFENIPVKIIIVNRKGEVTGFNRLKNRTNHSSPKIGDRMYLDYAAKHENNMYEELLDCIKSGKIKEFPELKYLDSFLNVRISPFRDGAIITKIDITKRKSAEKQIQVLTRQILEIQENERKRIARDLHDTVAQDLSSLKITCETFFDKEFYPPCQVKEKIQEISKVLHGSITAVRNIAYELRPPSLDELGLPITIYRYCEDFKEKHQINIDFFSAGLDGIRIDPNIEINLYRLVQESLNNVKKHSKAKRAIVRLVASYPDIILRVEDNGTGFDVSFQSLQKNSKSMGLRSMEERVNLLNGKIRISSRPGEGTVIVVKVPINKSEKELAEMYSKKTAIKQPLPI